LTIDLPLIVASFWSISAFYMAAQHELYPKNWKRSLVLLPALMAAGVALTVINTKAVFEALFGIKSAFARTAKYAVGDRKVKLEHGEYRRRSGWLPYAELAVVGYWWAGFSTLWQEYQGRLRWQRERDLALDKTVA